MVLRKMLQLRLHDANSSSLGKILEESVKADN